MSRAFRIVLVLMISLALPFQGAVAAAVNACAGHEARSIATMAVADVSAPHGHQHGHAHTPASDATAKSLEGHKTSASKCSVCAFCFFTAAGLPGGMPSLEPQALAEAVFPALITRAVVFTTGVPDRPPRPILA